jgi:hypothetical protein
VVHFDAAGENLVAALKQLSVPEVRGFFRTNTRSALKFHPE